MRLIATMVRERNIVISHRSSQGTGDDPEKVDAVCTSALRSKLLSSP